MSEIIEYKAKLIKYRPDRWLFITVALVVAEIVGGVSISLFRDQLSGFLSAAPVIIAGVLALGILVAFAKMRASHTRRYIQQFEDWCVSQLGLSKEEASAFSKAETFVSTNGNSYTREFSPTQTYEWIITVSGPSVREPQRV